VFPHYYLSNLLRAIEATLLHVITDELAERGREERESNSNAVQEHADLFLAR
jgi:hypothetical protein